MNDPLMQIHNFIDFDVIDNKITNDKLMSTLATPINKISLIENSNNINTNKPFNNNLLKNLTKTNTLDYLNNKR